MEMPVESASCLLLYRHHSFGALFLYPKSFARVEANHKAIDE
jgi:hypothetical protein